MSQYKEPKYDSDLVSYGFLKKQIIEMNKSEEDDTTISRSFSSPPNPPYYVGYTYTSNNKIYRCIKNRLVGSFNISDWVVIYDDKQEKLISQNFLFLSEIEISEQSDGKVESFYQDDDPSEEWDTSLLKSQHEGDYWRCKVNNIYHSYVYTKIATNPVTYDWIEIDIPIAIFDTINGHKNIFTEIPEEYSKNDFIKLMNQEMVDRFSIDCEIGDYLYSTTNNNSFDETNWLLKDDELSLKSLQSYYYTTEEISKIVEIINDTITADIVESEDSIKAFVARDYTTKTTTEALTQRVDANGNSIDEIIGTNTTQIPTRNLSQLSIWLDQIASEVSENLTLTSTITGTNRLIITDAMEGNLLELKIKGSMSLLFPSLDLFPSNSLFIKNSKLIIEHGDNTFDIITLPINRLRQLNDVSDEFIIGGEGTKLIKRIGVDEFNEEYVLPTPIIETYSDINIPLKDGINTIYLTCFQNDGLYFTATYALENEFTKTFATKIEMSSKILQSANAILLEVSELLDSPEGAAKIVSSINLSPDTIKLLASKIVLEGLVTANDNFKILLDGSIEAKNGSFKGDIFLDSGNKVIGGDGLLTNLYFSTTGRFQNFDILGFQPLSEISSGNIVFGKCDLNLDFNIPDNFTIVSAYITLFHTPAYWSVYNNSTGQFDDFYGYSRNLKLYKAESNANYRFYMTYGGEYAFGNNNIQLTEISDAFSSSSYTPSNTNSDTIESKTTINIKDYISKGNNKLVIRTSDSTPSNENTCGQKTGMARAVINIIGYTAL